MSDREQAHETWSEFERELLRSASGDTPSRGAGERVLVALGAGGGMVTSGSPRPNPGPGAGSASPAAGGVTKVALFAVAKWVALGALAVGAGVAAVEGARAPSRMERIASAPKADPTTTSVVPAIGPVTHATGHSAGHPPSFAGSAGSEAPPESPFGSRAAISRTSSGVAQRGAGSISGRSPSAQDDLPLPASPLAPSPEPPPMTPRPAAQRPDLAGEMASLDAARAALRAKKPALSLRALDDYAKAFGRGALEPEAIVLRIDSLLAADERAEAVTLGKQFLERFPRSPHAPRVRAELGL
jgi:hypothetical protein